MECPFCKSEMHAEASVCPTCRRDIYLFKPLLSRIGDLEAQVEQLNAELLVAKANGGDASTNGEGAGAGRPAISGASMVSSFLAGALLFVLPVVLLLLTHWLLVFVYDVRVLILRIVVLLIPLPFGYILARHRGLSLRSGIVLALAMGVVGVLGMSAITTHIDKVPLWPQSMLEWRELAEFSVSIAFSAITGMWLGRVLLRMANHAASEGWAVTAAKRMSANGSSDETIKDKAGRLEEIFNTVVATATTAVSIYTGFKDLMGGD